MERYESMDDYFKEGDLKVKEYENKPIQTIKKVLVKTTCDICKEEIKEHSTYYNIDISHSDWGDNSHESIKSKDVCSDECLSKIFQEYLEFKSETKKINIEKEELINKDW